MSKNFLEKNVEVLKQIDSTYKEIKTTINTNKNEPDINTWGKHFHRVWDELQTQAGWSTAKKSKIRLFIDRLFPKFRKRRSLKIYFLSKIFPSLKPLAKQQEPFFTQSPILQNGSDVAVTFPPEKSTYKTVYGFNMCSSGFDILYPLMTGHFSMELSETLLMLRILPHIDTFIDVGANIGFYSLLMAHEDRNNISIYAFEPGTENLKTLSAAIKANNMESKIKVLPYALSDKPGICELQLASFCSGDNSITPSPKVGIRGSESVKVETLDNIVEKFGFKQKNCFIKIDVEGHEEMVLMGGKNFFSSDNKPIVLVESWPISKKHPKNNNIYVLSFLESCGYDIFSVFHPRQGESPLLPFSTKHPRKNRPPIANYVAIPKSKPKLLTILNEPVDMRVFSSTEALSLIEKFLNNTNIQLKNRVNNAPRLQR